MRGLVVGCLAAAMVGLAAPIARAAQADAAEDEAGIPADVAQGEAEITADVAADVAGRRESVTFDVVRLFGVEGRTLVEIYSRIPTSALSFAEAGGRWEAKLDFALEVRKGEDVVLEDAWTRTKTVSDRRMLDSERVAFVETHAFLVPPGTYELAATIRDAAGEVVGTLRETLEAPAENPPASDILLATRISADTTEAAAAGYDPVRKNRLVLNPNPGQVYSPRVSPLLYFYYEFENVTPDTLSLMRALTFSDPATGRVVKEMRSPKTYQPGWTVDFGALNVAGLPAGEYEFELAWEAGGAGEMPEPYVGLTRRESFLIVHEAPEPGLAPEMAAAAGEAGAAETAASAAGVPVVDYYEGYSEARLDSVFELLDVLFESRERSLYRGLTPEGKRNFLNRFWARQDPDPATPENEFRREVDARLAYVQSNFGGPAQSGIQTPRGRIWLKYGKPDRRVERVLETGFSAPYEIWIYYQTGYKYVFLDEFRNRRYILLTSTDPEEQGRPDWQARLPADAVREILRE